MIPQAWTAFAPERIRILSELQMLHARAEAALQCDHSVEDLRALYVMCHAMVLAMAIVTDVPNATQKDTKLPVQLVDEPTPAKLPN